MNLRAPAVARRLGATKQVGVSDLVSEKCATISDVIQDSRVPNISVLGAGTKTANPISVVPLIGQIADELVRQEATVLMEAPPLLTSAESSAIIAASDSVLVVCRWGRTKRVDAWRVAEQLERLGVAVLGVVLIDSVVGGAPARSSSPGVSRDSLSPISSFNHRHSPHMTNGGSARRGAYQTPAIDPS
jgi:Mrp family chromosome partitioning ATPase